MPLSPQPTKPKATRAAKTNNSPKAITKVPGSSLFKGSSGSTLPFLKDVDHGLKFPEFDPNHHFASDLFTDSSSLQRTTKAAADAAVESIEEKRQTLRIANVNISLNTDVVKTGVNFQKFLGSVIDFGTAKVANQIKFTDYQTAGLNLQIAQTKQAQVGEKLSQENVVMSGLTELTPLISQEWEQRKALKQSRIEGLKQAVLQANQTINDEIRKVAALGGI